MNKNSELKIKCEEPQKVTFERFPMLLKYILRKQQNKTKLLTTYNYYILSRNITNIPLCLQTALFYLVLFQVKVLLPTIEDFHG